MDKQTIEKLVLTRLKSDPVMQSCIYACVRDDAHKDPMKYAQALSISAPAKRQAKTKTFVQIMTSKGKGNTTNAI